MAFNLLQPIAASSTTVAGFVALATSGAVAAGTDNTTALTPLGAKAVYAGLGSGNRFTQVQEIVVSGLPTLLNLSGGVNNYAEINIKNISNGSTASSDITVTANNGSASAQYANFGINGSGYAGAWGSSGDAYAYASDGHLWMGSNNSGKNIFLSAGNGGATASVIIAQTGVTFNIPITGVPLTPTATPLTKSKQIASTEYVDLATTVAQVALLQHDGYVQSDGATANRAQIYGPFDAVNNPREWVAGAAILTIAAVVTVPSATPSASQFITRIGSSSTPANYPTAYPNSLNLEFRQSTNSLYISQSGASGIGADYREMVNSSFRTTYSGQTIFLKITLTQGTATNPVIEVNGVNISASFNLATGGSIPAWLDATMVPTYRLVGYNWPAGPAPIVTPILGATSAADDAFYMQTGKWPAWVATGGQCFTPPNFTFVSGTNLGNITGSSASATAVTLAKTAGSTGNYEVSNAAIMGSLGGNIFGNAGASHSYIATGTLTVNTGSGTLNAGIGGTNFIAVPTGSFAITLQGLNNQNRFGFFANTAGDAFNYTITNFKLLPCGALSLPAYQPINVLDDVSGIGGNQGLLLGCTPVTNSTSFRVSANTWTNGNQQILAGSILDSTKHVIDLVEQSTTGTPTTTIGSVSAGADYKASAALSAGINPVTLVTRKLATNNIWVGSNSTAVIRTTIIGHVTK